MSIDIILKMFMSKIDEEIANGSFEKAVEIAIASYFFAKGRGKEAEEISLTHLFASFAGYLNQSEKDIISCSFCGRKPPEIKLFSGPNAFICISCVRDFNKLSSSELE